MKFHIVIDIGDERGNIYCYAATCIWGRHNEKSTSQTPWPLLGSTLIVNEILIAVPYTFADENVRHFTIWRKRYHVVEPKLKLILRLLN